MASSSSSSSVMWCTRYVLPQLNKRHARRFCVLCFVFFFFVAAGARRSRRRFTTCVRLTASSPKRLRTTKRSVRLAER